MYYSRYQMRNHDSLNQGEDTTGKWRNSRDSLEVKSIGFSDRLSIVNCQLPVFA